MLRKKVKEQEKEIICIKKENAFLEETSAFFVASRLKSQKNIRMKFIAIKTDDGQIKGEITFYCRMIKVSRDGFRKYLKSKDKPWKYEALAEKMRKINSEDECNDTYGRIRMFRALNLKNPKGIHIPSERTVYRVME